MGELRTKAQHGMDRIFRTGYPHPINLFVALMLTLIPLLSPYTWRSHTEFLPMPNHGLAGILSLLYLVVWSRYRAYTPDRPARSYRVYLLAQTIAVSLIYALDGGLTRFLFVVVAVQAVYVSPVRGWAPFLGSLAALWLTLYLVISPVESGASMVATIGMYFSYMVFSALVTFTTVQQEQQNAVAQELAQRVDERHHKLRALEQRIADRAEMAERERLAQTICSTLLERLGALLEDLGRLRTGEIPWTRENVRAGRLQAKDVLGAVRQAVRTLRPGEDGLLDDEDWEADLGVPPHPEVSVKWTDPLRVYHIWNVGVIFVTAGVMVASLLVAGSAEWAPLVIATLLLLAAYWGTAISKSPRSRSLLLVLQAALIIWMVALSQEPLMNHLFLIVAAQMIFQVPPDNKWLAASVAFPTLLSAVALWFVNPERPSLIFTLTAAFGVTNFFGAVTAFMTRRQEEARQRVLLYAQQLSEVNRMLEARLAEVRRIAIARERVRMAREIHDGLGHHLTIVVVELQYAEQLAEEDRDGAMQHIERAQSVIREAMHTAREMFETLERFERPLAQAIQNLVWAWRKGNPARVEVRVTGDFSGLSTAERITIYRAVQESLTNIHKHARPTLVQIALVELNDRVALTVVNDSQGPVPPVVSSRGGGFGLLGLKERAEAHQGEFTAGPTEDGGFKVRLVLPLGV